MKRKASVEEGNVAQPIREGAEKERADAIEAVRAFFSKKGRLDVIAERGLVLENLAESEGAALEFITTYETALAKLADDLLNFYQRSESSMYQSVLEHDFGAIEKEIDEVSKIHNALRKVDGEEEIDFWTNDSFRQIREHASNGADNIEAAHLVNDLEEPLLRIETVMDEIWHWYDPDTHFQPLAEMETFGFRSEDLTEAEGYLMLVEKISLRLREKVTEIADYAVSHFDKDRENIDVKDMEEKRDEFQGCMEAIESLHAAAQKMDDVLKVGVNTGFDVNSEIRSLLAKAKRVFDAQE
jgi:hypothetical protein